MLGHSGKLFTIGVVFGVLIGGGQSVLQDKVPLHNQLIRWWCDFRFIFKAVHLLPVRPSNGDVNLQGLRNYRSINTATFKSTKLVVQSHRKGRSTVEEDFPGKSGPVGRFTAELKHFRFVRVFV